jgi:hypothetical protein
LLKAYQREKSTTGSFCSESLRQWRTGVPDSLRRWFQPAHRCERMSRPGSATPGR